MLHQQLVGTSCRLRLRPRDFWFIRRADYPKRHGGSFWQHCHLPAASSRPQALSILSRILHCMRGMRPQMPCACNFFANWKKSCAVQLFFRKNKSKICSPLWLWKVPSCSSLRILYSPLEKSRQIQPLIHKTNSGWLWTCFYKHQTNRNHPSKFAPFLV